ncbi:MAG: copper transporter [Clostridia bacterium]|nr:copper transporter [Clostridia bacterium]
MFDLRYHIASLVAVFLSLGLGIIVGVTMVGDETLVKEQKILIDRLENDFRLLREKNLAVQKEIEEYKRTIGWLNGFAESAVPLLIKECLTDQRLAIIETGGYGVSPNLLTKLEEAGAEVVSVTSISSGLGAKGKELARVINGLSDSISEIDCYSFLAEEIGKMLFLSEKSTLQLELEKAGLIKTAGRYGDTFDAAIIVGGAKDENSVLVREFDLPLMKLVREKGVLTVGVEPSGAAYSYVSHYRNYADIVIDHIDTIPGQVALIWSLTGIPGYYGLKPGAQALLPALEDQFLTLP